MNLDLKIIHLNHTKEDVYRLSIYPDDTIDNIKSKLSRILKSGQAEEYYLFSKRKMVLNPYDSFKKLSFQNTRIISYETFYAFCINHGMSPPEKKESYELDDFLELKTDVLMTIPIGIVHEAPFVVDPFKNIFNQQDDSGTSSKMLWMGIPEIVDNTVYVCFASEVYDFSKKNGLEISKVFNVYYPYLYKNDKLSPSRFGNILSTDYSEYNNLIDFHHKIYTPDAIISDGITCLFFVMYTLQPFHFPLDIFFKLFQSSHDFPYIKLNGHKTTENIYRLYCNQYSENGYKIPYLKKKTVLKYGRSIHKHCISYLVFYKEIPIFLNLDRKGHIYFEIDQIPFLSIEKIEEFLKVVLHDFTSKLQQYFDPSHKIFTSFDHLHQSNISIIDMKYKCIYRKEGKINVKKYMSCFSPVFNFMEEKGTISLRYKRVSNYNESQSKDAYLIESFNKNIPIEEIIQAFSVNFMKHDDKAAADYVYQFFSTIEIEEKQNNLRKVKINPGFLVEIEKHENIEVTIHSIDNIQYIPFIKLFVTNLVLISQGIISDDGKCKKVKEITVKEIVQTKPETENIDDFKLEDDIDEIDEIDEPEEMDEPLSIESSLSPPKEVNLNSLSPPKNDTEDSLSPPKNDTEDSLSPPKEVNLNSLSPPKEVNLNSLSPPKEVNLNSLSPPKSKGGTLSPDKVYDVFIYDENDPFSIKERFGKKPHLVASIPDYYRAFQGLECTLIKKEHEICKGFVVELKGSELKEIMRDATIKFIDYFDKPGNSYAGVTYTREPKEWNDHPTVQFVKKVYATVAYGWTNKQDNKDEMFIYDIHNELKAKYNGKYYVKLDEDDELTKVQFTPVNPLLKRLQDREPVLFTKTDKTHNQYSRMCLWSEKRQPVILTKEEKDKIDEISPGSYDSSIEYGTDSKKPYYYICPRYWDLKHNLPVSPDKVDKTKLISRNSSDSEKQRDIQSRYILELAKPGDKPVYQTRVGFLTKKHPSGYYMPCCFISKPKKDKPDAIDKRTEEAMQYYKRETEGEVKEKITDYIQNGDKFPLPENRKGHLTPILEKFFNISYSDCYSQLQKKKLKLNYPCLLRYGVKEEQSFLSSLSFLYFKKYVPLETFLKVIIDKLTLDNIQMFHNGGIVHTFSKEESHSISKYTETKLYKTMKDTSSFRRIVNGYENFISYLKSKDYIDYTYLWDIVTQLLFKDKVNMIILKEGLEDVTHNLTIVCPTTSHALYLFNEKTPSILLYQNGNLFEPLYIYKKMANEKDKTITQFDLKETVPSVHDILKKIHDKIGPSCRETTIHKTYHFKENLYLHQLLDELKKTDYKVLHQIMNIDGRIFGVVVSNGTPFFVPCLPSAVSGSYILMDDSLWRDYRTTVHCLKKLEEDSNHQIPCKPKIRVLENEMVVGILTETNQFVPLKEPEENKMKDELITLEEKNHIKVDEIIQTGKIQHKEKVIHHLKLEQMFYHAYFNTIKVELNDSALLTTRKKIEKAIQAKDKKKLDLLFEPIIDAKFLFIDKYDIDLSDIETINLCKNNKEPYCGRLEHEGKLLIPKVNLFNQMDNEEAYKNRFIDDLMMNVHIQRIILEEIHSTLYYTDRYQLSEDEILLMESDLSMYLDKVPVKRIKSVLHPLLEDVLPSKIIEVANKIEPEQEVELIPVPKEDEMDLSSEEEPEVDTIELDSPERTAPIGTSLNAILPKRKSPENKVEPIVEETVLNLDEPLGTSLNAILPKSKKLKKKVETIVEETGLNLDEPTIDLNESDIENESHKSKSDSSNSDSDSESDTSEDEPPKKEKSKPSLIKKPIEALSKKISEHKNAAKPNSKKAEIYVQKAKELYRKERTPATEKVLLQAQEHLQELDPVRIKKIRKIDADIIPCIKTFYFKKNSKWKNYFPPKTIGFRIMKGDTYDTAELDLRCNFIMALQILKSYRDDYQMIKIRDVKDMLVKGYKHLESTIPNLDKKFKKEKKRFTKWEEIQLETYPFTQLDMIVLMIEYKLPVVIFIQAKNKIKLLTYHTDDTFKYYIKMKKKDVFMFFIYKNNFEIERKDMDALYQAERDIVYLNRSSELISYFDKY